MVMTTITLYIPIQDNTTTPTKDRQSDNDDRKHRLMGVPHRQELFRQRDLAAVLHRTVMVSGYRRELEEGGEEEAQRKVSKNNYHCHRQYPFALLYHAPPLWWELNLVQLVVQCHSFAQLQLLVQWDAPHGNAWDIRSDGQGNPG
jgi:hypothetical protein